MKAQSQIVIAVSETAKAFVKGLTLVFSAPSKSKPDGMNATEREVFDACVAFVEKFRFTEEERFKTEIIDGVVTETAEIEKYQFDHFAGVIGEVMAERMTTVRVINGGKVTKLEAEKAELERQVAEWQAKFAQAAKEKAGAEGDTFQANLQS
jgi:hypothetical protein